MRFLQSTNLLIFAGLILLGWTIFLPTISADRVARVELRAARTADVLLDVAASLDDQGVDPTEESAFAKLAAAVANAAIDQVPDSDLPRVAAPGILENKHYLFRVERRPAPVRREMDAPSTTQPLDVYAWPKELGHPGRSVFYAPEVGRPAFTRNLVAGYHGIGVAPEVGAGVPGVISERGNKEGFYRSQTHERWLWTAPAR